MDLVTLDLQAPVRKDAVSPISWPLSSGGWFGIFSTLRERFAGAWQRGIGGIAPDVMRHSTYWACVTLIASDISKLRLKLVSEDANGICTEITNTAYSPVLTKPNHYQNRIAFLQNWILSKANYGNTYVLKERNHRGGTNQGNVTGLYILDPQRVKPLVSPDGEIFYQVQQDFLSGVQEQSITIPASEIIHDLWNAIYHPLCGLSPIFACGLAAMQGLKIQEHTAKLFANGSNPGGILTAPGTIPPDAAKRIQEHWEENYAGEHNIGRVAVLGNGLSYVPMGMNAVDAQLIDQLKWSDEKVCSVFHVPSYMVGVGAPPNYNNIEALNQQYYSQCLQNPIEAIELCLKEGLAIADPSYVELDLDGLLRMDSATKMKAATDGVRGGVYTPNEARQMFNKRSLEGGDTVYLQQQDHSLAALARRDAQPDPFSNVRETFTGPTGEPAPPPEGESGKGITPTIVRELVVTIVRELRNEAPEEPDQTDAAIDALEDAWAA